MSSTTGPRAGAKRIGIAGLGAIAEAHLAAYAHLPGVEVVAAADPSVAARERGAARGLRVHATAEALLAAEPLDALCVLASVAAHRPVVEAAASHGVPVLCEKPLAASAADGEAMVAACAAAGVRLGYGSSYRYLGAMTRARALIAQGALGDVALLVETLTGGGGRADQRAIGEDHYPRGGAGGTSMGLVDHGIHMLDCLPWLVDAPVRSIRGRGNRSGEALRPEHAQLELEGGALCQLLYWDGSYDVALPSEGAFSLGGTWDIHGRYAPPGRWQPPGVEIRVFGSQGALRILPYAHHLYLADADGLRAVPVPSPASPLHFAAQLSAFLDAIERGEAPPVGGADGVAALRLLEAIYDDDREPAREPVPH